MSIHDVHEGTCHVTTSAVRAGIDSDTAHGAVTPPIVLSSNFSFERFGHKRKYDYTRSANPTRDLLGEALAELEGGAGGVVTATGIAAITLVLHALLRPGDRLVVPHDAYGGSWRLFNALAQKGHFELITVDLTDARSLVEALALPPKLVLIETPSNPLLRITDLGAVIEAAHRVGALTVVDNTFMSPVLQRPLEFGADLVLHSTTKYINGHSDVVGGVVVARDVAHYQQLVWWANALGLTGSPFDAFLTLRGVRTLDARLRVHQENAQMIAALLEGHGVVKHVHYPGLASHPGHVLAGRQQKGFGAMLSFELQGGEEAVRAFVSGLRYFTLAESLGGVESLIAHPASMTHAAMTPEARAKAGISDGLLRLSVGIEAGEDLIVDLVAGLRRAQAVCDGAAREECNV
ncbi:O-succinylhomoserine (thiol)-lyase [Xylella fastidiosa]|uniref:O-succinylhomoserine (Thiol)-lyase n=1 Tax=Xylella fastidiosa subsp. multiplex TaxID=644357 RepID=A0A9Q4MHC6_XYLFS|nr:O-succinylhomoserine (thiol)-lyase [Xylella fastidiosa]ERI60035.1 cystathionine gamma-synthase [Xylella fastidiosa subsp. multiplex Griffin-1]ACA12855.1 Cystathionine gamma-synthase [Xylella fastidiosa M12]KAJ4853570.1 O-succinylhomoserine (thiol)-lyase [Xylella fastidiosa subsp. multiplex]KFA40643.1 cystathionine gamma-synthase [Xylella fastidiosa]MBE0269452.1 O-succinylhomoserine (thiol)-lyase [Xylella fastidiosa subsp. multiplex]